jgi:hypothetical protein
MDMGLPPLFLESLQAISTKEAFEIFTERPWGSIQTTLDIVNEIRPADLYCYLAARFGPPNGVQNILRSPGSDNLIHWDWTLRHERGVIVFLGMSFRTEIHIFGCSPDDRMRDELIEQIRADLPRHGAAIGQARQQLEQWTEFVNPYQRVRRAVMRLLSELEDLKLLPSEDRLEPFDPSMPQEELLSQWTELSRKYSQAFGLAFGIRSMLPVMAEAFVNLLLYVLMRPELRSDSRLFDNAFRQPIDVRVKSLSINCAGFSRQPDYAFQACRDYHTLVNERNDLLHGNVVVDKLKFNEVYFAGDVPVFKQYRSMWDRSFDTEARAVGLATVQAEVATVNTFTDYLSSCIDERIRERIVMITERQELGLNQETRRVGILFPGWLVDMRGQRSQETEQHSGGATSGIDEAQHSENQER